MNIIIMHMSIRAQQHRPSLDVIISIACVCVVVCVCVCL